MKDSYSHFKIQFVKRLFIVQNFAKCSVDERKLLEILLNQ